MIYDIFGPSSQALQGADHISQHFDNCIVIMPDLFKGSALGYDQRAKAREFLAGPGHFSLNASAVRLDVVPAVRELFPQLDSESLGAFGLCCGGKIVVLAANFGATDVASFSVTGRHRSDPSRRTGRGQRQRTKGTSHLSRERGRGQGRGRGLCDDPRRQ